MISWVLLLEKFFDFSFLQQERLYLDPHLRDQCLCLRSLCYLLDIGGTRLQALAILLQESLALGDLSLKQLSSLIEFFGVEGRNFTEQLDVRFCDFGLELVNLQLCLSLDFSLLCFRLRCHDLWEHSLHQGLSQSTFWQGFAARVLEGYRQVQGGVPVYLTIL